MLKIFNQDRARSNGFKLEKVRFRNDIGSIGLAVGSGSGKFARTSPVLAIEL